MDGPQIQPIDGSLQVDEEQQLVADLKAGNEEAYAQVVRVYGGRMLAVARRFLRQDQDAQDAVQDAFLSAFRAIDKFEGSSRLSTWLHRIVVNASLMKIRSQKRKPEKPINDLLPKYLDDGHLANTSNEWVVTYDTAIADRETREVVRQGIDQLPDTYRTVLLLRDIEQKSTEETAELLQISPGAVKTRLHRARQALRTLLDPHMQGETR